MKGLVAVAILAATTVASAPVYAGARVYVRIGPPAPIVEVRGVAPGPGYVWLPGYHRWNGFAYVWVPGHWALAPARAHVWVPGHWARDRHGWFWVGGHWRA